MSGPTSWRTVTAKRFGVIVDADEYFAAARAAMLKAKRRIMLIGWDFDARIRLVTGGREPGEPEAVGDFIHWLVGRNPDLEMYLLRWDVGVLKALRRGTTLLTLVRWLRHPRIHTKLDGHHPTGASHHQKIVVIDDALAFCGGIDMTGERWDTRAHRDHEPGRRLKGTRFYKPWHDAIAALDGPAAETLAELARQRWMRAGARPIAPVTGGADCWPDDLAPLFRDISVEIARTEPAMPGAAEVREIEASFVDQIRRARHHVYAESQYFASRRIAEAIADRLAEPDGPEFVIVNPLTAQGWLEPIAMDTARARLMAVLQTRDPHGRLRMYHPFSAEGAPIYVHAKVMIVDGCSLRVGSANMNNRSMGLDTECDVIVDTRDDAAAATAVEAVRDGLLAEHLGTTTETVAAEIAARGSLIETIEALRGDGRSLRPYVVPEVGPVAGWLADNEVLDPESPAEMFELTTETSLLRRLRRRVRRS